MRRQAIIVDDNPEAWEMLRQVLVEDGRYGLIAAVTDGELALALADQRAPDLVLMDLRLPGLNGIETARQLRARHPETTIVLVSGYLGDDEEYRRAAQEAGIRACIPKRHFNVTALKEALEAPGEL